jgi:Trk-type K+ transport system membrane component
MESSNKRGRSGYRRLLRDLVEAAFIVFLFYANLLMGEYTREGKGWERGFAWALHDIFTVANFEIAVVAAIVGHYIFELLRKRF